MLSPDDRTMPDTKPDSATDANLATITGLVRYPVKSLTPQALEAVTLEADACLPHDRRYAIAHGAAQFDSANPAWVAKRNFAVLAKHDQLAALTSDYDPETEQLSLSRHGKVVTQGKASWPRKGYICLESEGSPVQFRNLKLKELPSTGAKAEETAHAFDGFRSLYTGVDLSGWEGEGWHSNDWRLNGTKAEARLECREKFASYSFFADWRSKEKAVPFNLPNLRKLGALDHPVGKWNRIQVTRVLGSTTVEINGKSVLLEMGLEIGPLRSAVLELLPGAEFANIFVKELSP